MKQDEIKKLKPLKEFRLVSRDKIKQIFEELRKSGVVIKDEHNSYFKIYLNRLNEIEKEHCGGSE